MNKIRFISVMEGFFQIRTFAQVIKAFQIADNLELRRQWKVEKLNAYIMCFASCSSLVRLRCAV